MTKEKLIERYDALSKDYDRLDEIYSAKKKRYQEEIIKNKALESKVEFYEIMIKIVQKNTRL